MSTEIEEKKTMTMRLFEKRKTFRLDEELVGLVNLTALRWFKLKHTAI